MADGEDDDSVGNDRVFDGVGEAAGQDATDGEVAASSNLWVSVGPASGAHDGGLDRLQKRLSEIGGRRAPLGGMLSMVPPGAGA